MNKKSTTWTTVFWIVLVLCILQYLFMTLPNITKVEGGGLGLFIGSLLPNSIIVLIFWFIKNRSEKNTSTPVLKENHNVKLDSDTQKSTFEINDKTKFNLDVTFEEQMTINTIASIVEKESLKRNNIIIDYKKDKDAIAIVYTYFPSLINILLKSTDKFKFIENNKDKIDKYASELIKLVSEIMNNKADFVQIRKAIEYWIFQIQSEVDNKSEKTILEAKYQHSIKDFEELIEKLENLSNDFVHTGIGSNYKDIKHSINSRKINEFEHSVEILFLIPMHLYQHLDEFRISIDKDVNINYSRLSKPALEIPEMSFLFNNDNIPNRTDLSFQFKIDECQIGIFKKLLENINLHFEKNYNYRFEKFEIK